MSIGRTTPRLHMSASNAEVTYGAESAPAPVDCTIITLHR